MTGLAAGVVARLAGGGILKTVGSVLSTIPKPVWYALAGLLALLFAWHVHTGWEQAARDKAFNAGYNADFNREQPYIRAMQASIANLQAAIAQQNAAVDKLAKDGDARKQAALTAINAAQEAAQRNSALEKALEASAAQKRPAGDCRPSAAYLNAKDRL